MYQRLFYVVLVLCVSVTAVHAEFYDDLVAYWPLNEGSGNDTADLSGNDIEGDLDGDPNWVEGKFGQALEFDGTDDYVDCGNPSILDFGTSDFTLSAWVKTSATSNRTIFGKGGDDGGGIRYHLFVHTCVKILVDDDETKHDPEGSISVSDDEWHYIVGMRDGTSLRLFIDGVEDEGVMNDEEDAPLPANYNISGTSMYGAYIGGITSNNNGTVYKFFEGVIDDMAVWNRALTEEEISFLWNEGEGVQLATVINKEAASHPYPEDTAEDVENKVVLSWESGQSAETHDVYFSDTFDDVNDGLVLAASDIDVNTFDPGLLEYDQTYYWRVDETGSSSGIQEGTTWSFTTEPYSTAISAEDVDVTASSYDQENAPTLLIDGSGLTDSAHSNNLDDMWVSGSGDDTPWLLFEFSTLQKLDKILLWNSNTELETLAGLGVKDVNILYSVDGDQWTALPGPIRCLQASGATDYNTPQELDLGLNSAKYVQLDILGNWSTGFTNLCSLSEVQFMSIPVSAREPDPASGETEVSPTATLSWRAGREANVHQIYFSTDEQAVVDGTAPMATVSATTYAPSLLLGTTYYWRVEEVNAAMDPSLWTSETWSLTTADKIVIDDFESYTNNSPYRIFQTWQDGYGYTADDYVDAYSGNGTGAMLGHDIWNDDFTSIMETDIVNDGAQSMPFYYEGSGSQTDLQLDGEDWTDYGIATLVVHFYGAADNTGELYVKIGNTKIEYSGEEADIAAETWITWEIDLDTSGASLTNVKTLSIGVDGSNASGLLYIDDIQLQ